MLRLRKCVLFVLAILALGPLTSALPDGGSNSAVAQAAPPKLVDSLRWRAWVDAMPGPNKRANPFYVTGEVVVPTPGYKVTLVPEKRSLRAPVLILILTIERIRPPDAVVITSYHPRYDDTTPPRRYTGVEIRYQGRTIARIDRISTIR